MFEHLNSRTRFHPSVMTNANAILTLVILYCSGEERVEIRLLQGSVVAYRFQTQLSVWSTGVWRF